jgi:hypothetical protein
MADAVAALVPKVGMVRASLGRGVVIVLGSFIVSSFVVSGRRSLVVQMTGGMWYWLTPV